LERKTEQYAPDYCDQCGRSDTCELGTTGKLMPLWIDHDTGETVCERCKDKYMTPNASRQDQTAERHT
jgi:hypothetical protein